MEQDWRCSDHWSPPQWVHFVSWFQQHQWFLQANAGVEIAPKKPPFETETKSFQLLVNSYLPSCCFQTDRFHISRQILFGEFEFSPTPETVSVAFGIKEDDPVKEWGSTNAENKANYGGASAWNLKKPAMQQDDGTVGWLVGWLGPGASHRLGPTSTVWGQSCMGGGETVHWFWLVKISWWCFFQVIYSLHLEIPWFEIRLAVTRSMEKNQDLPDSECQSYDLNNRHCVYLNLTANNGKPMIQCNGWTAMT